MNNTSMRASQNIFTSKRTMIWNNFIGGIAWSVGAWIGTTVIIEVIAYILSKMNYVPVVGTFVSEIVKFVAANNPQL